VSLSTGNLFHFVAFQRHYKFGLWLVRAAVFILRHRSGVGVTQLTTATAAPGVESALIGKSNRVSIATCDLHYFDIG